MEFGDGELGGPGLGGSVNRGSGVAGRAFRSDRGYQRFDNSPKQEPSAFEHPRQKTSGHKREYTEAVDEALEEEEGCCARG